MVTVNKDKSESVKLATELLVKPGKLNGQKQTSTISLSKNQIEAVLKSLKVPVPMSKSLKKPGEFNEIIQVEPGSASSSKITVEERKTIVCSIKTENSNKRPGSPLSDEENMKRIKLQFPTPPSQDNSPTEAKKCMQERVQQIASELQKGSKSLLSPAGAGSKSLLSPAVADSDCEASKAGLKTFTVNLPDHRAKYLQLNGCKPQAQKLLSPLPSQIVQGVPMATMSVQGQPINFMVPVAFSPPLTPNTVTSSPTIFSFPSSTSGLTSFPSSTQGLTSILVQQTNTMTSSSPQMTSSTLSQLITPTDRPLAPPTGKVLGYTPGGILASSLLSKDTYPTARKLDLKLPTENSA